MNTRKLLIAAMGAALAIGGATTACAQSDFGQNHPARDQVNDRLTHQSERIVEARRNGDISPAKARRLHMAERRIRHRERHFAMMHHGRISHAEQARLNGRENAVSHRIGE